MKIVKENYNDNKWLYQVGNVIADCFGELYIVAEVGNQYALISLSTGRAANTDDFLLDSLKELEEAYSNDGDQLVYGKHLVDFSNEVKN